MSELLKKISEKYGVNFDIIEKIIEIEKNNVYKLKRRNIFGDLTAIIEESCGSEKNNDYHKD